MAEDLNRLRNWARAYQRLMQGGLAEVAHAACVEDFASDEGEYPYITAADVLALLDRVEAAEAAVERVRALANEFQRRHQQPQFTGDYGMDSTASSCWYDAEGALRAALDGER